METLAFCDDLLILVLRSQLLVSDVEVRPNIIRLEVALNIYWIIVIISAEKICNIFCSVSFNHHSHWR